MRAVGFGTLTATATVPDGAGTARTYTGHGDAELDARSRQGFEVGEGAALSSCFALCADRDLPSRCAGAVRDAVLTGDLAAPPPPGVPLGALLAMVHHPGATAWAGALLLAALGALAIVTRKRPKRRRLR